MVAFFPRPPREVFFLAAKIDIGREFRRPAIGDFHFAAIGGEIILAIEPVKSAANRRCDRPVAGIPGAAQRDARRDQRQQAAERVLGSDGWCFESIQLKLQTDGSSCGVW